MSCHEPIDAAVLADHWIGALDGRELDAVEEHLLACGECAARFSEVIALSEGIRRVAREGSLRMVVSEAHLERAAELGTRIRAYAPASGGRVQCTVTAEDDLLVSRLAADLAGAERVDLAVCDERGVERERLRDVPVGAGADGIVLQESITAARAWPTATLIYRLLALDQAGHERTVGEYTFHHTRTMP